MKTMAIRCLLTLMAVLCVASAMAGTRTIDRPQYVWNSTDGLEVESIALSDTATTVAILYTGRPKERFSIARQPHSPPQTDTHILCCGSTA